MKAGKVLAAAGISNNLVGLGINLGLPRYQILENAENILKGNEKYEYNSSTSTLTDRKNGTTIHVNKNYGYTLTRSTPGYVRTSVDKIVHVLANSSLPDPGGNYMAVKKIVNGQPKVIITFKEQYGGVNEFHVKLTNSTDGVKIDVRANNDDDIIINVPGQLGNTHPRETFDDILAARIIVAIHNYPSLIRPVDELCRFMMVA